MIVPGRRAPSATLPLSFLVTGVLAFVLAALAAPWLARELAGHYYHPRVLALTHTVTLGWITMAIMGASYQLIPIVLERPIWSERLGRWQFALMLAGVVGMVAHFYIAQWPGLLWGVALVALGTIAHLVNVMASVRGLARWTFTARMVVIAHAAFALTVVFGAALGVQRVVPFLPGQHFPNLHAHFHLALLGWVLPMVVGVAARVYPMFLLAREPAGPLGSVQLWGIGAGVPVLVAGILTSSALTAVGAVAVAAAVIAHGGWIVGMARSARRPALDWGLRFVLTGAACLVPATALGLALAIGLLSGPRPALAYAVLALGGWVSLTIAGMMLKIVPFLVWYRVYSGRVGRGPVPTLAQLSSPRAEATAYALLAGGMIALAGAVATGDPVLIRTAGLVTAAGALAFVAILARVLRHLAAAHGAPGAAGPPAPRQAASDGGVPSALAGQASTR